MVQQLGGRVAVITGGATGIGLAVAKALVRHGASVVLAGRDRERGEQALAMLEAGPARAMFVRTDVRYEPDVEHLFRFAANRYGRIDLLFNNAGVEGSESAADLPPGWAVHELLDVNVAGVLLSIKHGLPWLTERRGTIVNTSSFVGTTTPLPHAVVYGATKAAVLSITRSMAARCASQSVSVFAVCPWITDTPMVDRLTGHNPAAKAQFGEMNPSGRIASPEDVADVVLGMVTGAWPIASGDAVLVDAGGAVTTVVPMAPGRTFEAASQSPVAGR